MGGPLGRILGCPRDLPDCLEGSVWGDNLGGSWDVLGILWTAWMAVCVRTSREDPRMSFRQSGILPRLEG